MYIEKNACTNEHAGRQMDRWKGKVDICIYVCGGEWGSKDGSVVQHWTCD